MNSSRIKIAFHTLGCKLNYTETSTMSRLFPAQEFEVVSSENGADIYVINTCSVTGTAERKCRQAIKKFIKQSPEALIAAVGCYAQLRPQAIAAIPGVDLVLGNCEKFDIAEYIRKHPGKGAPAIHSALLPEKEPYFPAWSVGGRTRSFLKVQDGCDYNCSYCTVPLARGKSRNQDIASIVREAELIAEKGIKEIVITGVNTGDFGRSTGENLAGLLKKLVLVKGIERYRISSIEPNLLTNGIIDIIAGNDKLMPHFHIPLQSGSDRMLGLMRRRYRREMFVQRVNHVRKLMPLAGIGADIIAGFPGESDSDFNDTFRFISDMPISYLHVFKYSDRLGTVSEKMTGKIKPSVKEIRTRKLSELSDQKHLNFCLLNKDMVSEVLFEGRKGRNLITGFTGNYIRVEYPRDEKLEGQIRKVVLKETVPSGNMTAEIID